MKNTEYINVIITQINKISYQIEHNGKIYNIPNYFSNKALTGDLVKVKISKNLCFVKKILQRNENVLIGKVSIKKNIAFIKAWSNNQYIDYFINLDKFPTLKHNDVIKFKFFEWKKAQKNPKAELIEVLNNIDKNDELYLKFNINTQFNDNVFKELEEINIIDTNRLDLRDLTTFTIDPENCTDIDDALSFETTLTGFRVYIHISDVSFFVKTGTEIDKEAYMRGFTYYNDNNTVPMLPHKLSSDICSLKEYAERLAVSIIINIDKKFNIIDYNIVRSIIINKHKFTYEEAELYKNDTFSLYYTDLNLLYTIGQKIRKELFPNELILSKEENIWLDNKIKIKKRNSCMDLIQSWMLITNYLVTKKIESYPNTPWIYRTHDKINKENLELLNQQ